MNRRTAPLQMKLQLELDRLTPRQRRELIVWSEWLKLLKGALPISPPSAQTTMKAAMKLTSTLVEMRPARLAHGPVPGNSWKRAAAAEARRERLEAAEEAAEEGTVNWKPTRANWQTLDRPKKRRHLSLTDVCVQKVADFVDCVESLVGLPQIHINAIASCASARRQITPEVWRLFTEGNPIEVNVANCTAVTDTAMIEGLKACCTPMLQVLDLGFCGRGFGDPAAASFAEAGPLSALLHLRLAGAYRLTAHGLLSALAAAPNITSLQLPNCVRLEGPEVPKIAEVLPNLACIDLSGCRGLDSVHLAEGLKSMKCLVDARLDQVQGVNDTVLESIASPQLQVLHVRRCRNITDAGVAAVATAATSALTEIALCKTPVTTLGFEVLAAHCPSIHSLTLRQCRRIKSEDALIAIAQNKRLRHLDISYLDVATGAVLQQLTESRAQSLESISHFCRNVPAAAVGLLLDECKELRDVHVYGCSQLTRAALRGHRNDWVMVSGEPTFGNGLEDAAAGMGIAVGAC